MFFGKNKEKKITKAQKKNNATVSEILPLIEELPEEEHEEVEKHLDSIISEPQKLRLQDNHTPKTEKEKEKKSG